MSTPAARANLPEDMKDKAGFIGAGIVVAVLGFVAAGLIAPASAHRSTSSDPSEPTTAASSALPTTATETTSTQTTTATTTTTPTHPPVVVLPIKSLTPGAYNKAVRQKTIRKTICRSGWMKKIRLPVSYTDALKLTQMVRYGETGSPSDYEEDHFIPLELGGAPRNPRNLWPEPVAQSRVSDPLEKSLTRKVWSGAMKLAKARAAIRAFKIANG